MDAFFQYLSYFFLLPIGIFFTAGSIAQTLPKTTENLIVNYGADYHEGLVRVDLAPADFSWSRNAYLDRTGKIVFWLPESDTIYSDFSDGLAVLRGDTKCGYVDPKGAVVIAAQFDQCAAFTQGRAPVKIGTAWGIIDKSGKLIVPPGYEAIRVFSEGYAAAELNHHLVYLNLSGEKVIDILADEGKPAAPLLSLGSIGAWGSTPTVTATPAGDFHEGMVRFSRSGHWGFMDRTGSIKIAPQFDASSDFSQGRAWVSMGNHEFFIYPSGQPATARQTLGFFVTHQFSEGLITVKSVAANDGISGVAVMDKGGKITFNAAYAFIDSYHEGRAAVQSEDGKFGYIDTAGNTILPARYLRVGKFCEGKGAVQLTAQAGLPVRYGYVDINGQFISLK